MIDASADWSGFFATVFALLQILAVDLLLSADNAVMIALASRGHSYEDTRLVAVVGTAGAIVLRLAMATATVLLLHVPLLKIVAAVALFVIAVRLTLAPDDSNALAALGQANAAPLTTAKPSYRTDLLGAIGAIIAADAIMSLDNVVALAAISGGSVILLGFGLALSIPMLIWGSLLIRRFLDENPLLVLLSGMFLAWLAGEIGVSDPIVAPWIEQNAPALPFAVPIACAAFVLWQRMILGPRQVLQGGHDAG